MNWTDGYPWDDDEGRYQSRTWSPFSLSKKYSLQSSHGYPSILFSRSGPAASIRIYYEIFGSSDVAVFEEKPAIPNGVSYFPKELVSSPRL